MTWSGDVDDTTIVSIHGGDVRTDTVHGKDAANVNEQVFGYLPHAPIYVFLRHREGRGQVRIVQQPNPDNNFTAKVRIHDPQAGRTTMPLIWGGVRFPLTRILTGTTARLLT